MPRLAEQFGALETCVEFETQRGAERRNLEQHIMPRLQEFTKNFFRNENESSLVRPLCFMMGFLQPVNDAYDVLGAAVDSVGLQR